MELTTCPECGATAAVTWRYCEESTDGPVEHVRLSCVQRHWFMGPAASLLTGGPGRPADAQRQPSTPVLAWDWPTGLLSGEPRWRK